MAVKVTLNDNMHLEKMHPNATSWSVDDGGNLILHDSAVTNCAIYAKYSWLSAEHS